MIKPSLARIIRGVRVRLARKACFVIFSAPPCQPSPLGKGELSLLRINRESTQDLRQQAEQAMQVAGEPAGLTMGRFAHGDEFFGWMLNQCIISFGWVTYRQRRICSLQMRDLPGRVFLYNFHTAQACREGGLYRSLLLVLRQQLGDDGAREFVIDVNSRNTASLHGVTKAGFAEVARVRFLVLFNHGCLTLQRSVNTGTLQEWFLK